jgi:alpha-L-fucosidase 2
MLAACTYASLLTTHPPGGTNPNITFQIDGNLGTPAAVAEMIVQSHGGVIRLLPALPSSWATGSVSGLRLRGGFVVDIAWSDHRLTDATIVATVDGPLRLLAPDPLGVVLANGIEFVTGGAVTTIDARAGQRFELRPVATVPGAATSGGSTWP